MANQVTGRIAAIGQTVQIPSKTGAEPFTKREFLLDATTYDPYTGERSQYENILPLELSGERCADLDQFREGDVVTVSFALQGRSWTNQQGELKRMAAIRCYRIEARGAAPTQAPQPTAPSQQAYQPGASYGTAPDPFPPAVDAAGNVKDDLPF